MVKALFWLENGRAEERAERRASAGVSADKAESQRSRRTHHGHLGVHAKVLAQVSSISQIGLFAFFLYSFDLSLFSFSEINPYYFVISKAILETLIKK